MDTQNHQDFQQLARKTAGYFARNCWWTDRDDLQSEAYLSLLEFYASPPPSFDPKHPQSRNYAGTVASRHLSRWCFTQSSPVSAASRSQRRDKLAGLQRISMSPEMIIAVIERGRRGVARSVFDKEALLSACTGDMEAEIMLLEATALVPKLHAKLRERLHEIYEDLFPDQPLDVSEACIDVLAENAKSTDAAEGHAVPVRTVYRRTERLKTQACRDGMVRELLTQIQESRGDCNDYA